MKYALGVAGITSAAFALIANSVSAAKKRRIVCPERDGRIRRLRRGWFGIVSGEADPPKIKFTLWRRCRCRRRSRRAKIELHGRGFFRARLRSEERFRRKTEHARDQICRETAHRHVVVLHRLVEVAALDGNSVLGSFQLRL